MAEMPALKKTTITANKLQNIMEQDTRISRISLLFFYKFNNAWKMTHFIVRNLRFRYEVTKFKGGHKP